MMKNQQKSTPNQNISPFDLLNDNQWRYVTACIENPSFNQKQAAEHVGIKANTVYTWDDYVKDAIELARKDIHQATLARRKALTLKALAVKASGLDSEDENIRQRTATELLEWELGKATNRTEHTGAGGGAIEVRNVAELTDEQLARIASKGG